MGVETVKQYIYSFMFGSEVSIDEKMRNNLLEGEEIISAFKAKDTLGIFTNKRIMYRGLLFGQSMPLIGKEIYIYYIPYKSIDYFATEFSDTTLFDAFKHVTLWTKGNNQISLLFDKDVDIRKIRNTIAMYVL